MTRKEKLLLAFSFLLIFLWGATHVSAAEIIYNFDSVPTTTNGTIPGFSSGNQTTGRICDTISFSTPNSVCEGATFASDYHTVALPVFTDKVYIQAQVYAPEVIDLGTFNNDRGYMGIGFDGGNPFIINTLLGKYYLTPGLSTATHGVGWSRIGILAEKNGSNYDYFYYVNGNQIGTSTSVSVPTQASLISYNNTTNENSALDNYLIQTDNDVSITSSTSPLTNPTTIDFNTRFTSGVVTGASSSTVTFDIDYFLETSEFSSQNKPDILNINVLANGFFNDSQVAAAQRFILPLTQGANSKNVVINDHAFEDGNYLAYVNFWNLNTQAITFSATGMVLEFEVAGGVVVSSTIAEIFDGTTLSQEVGVVYQECSLTNIGGCLINALSYVFIPDSTSFSQFGGVWDSIKTKPPFGYIVSIIEVFTGLNDSAAAAFSFGNIPFISTIFDPLKLLLASLLWFFYAVWFYIRMTKLEI